MAFELVASEIFASKLKKLDRSIVIEIEKKLDALRQEPRRSEHRMHPAHEYYRIYIRSFRLIYKVDRGSVILFDIIKRKQGYGQLG